MLCIVHTKRNHAAVVRYRDAGRWQGRIIPEVAVRGTKIGAKVEIDRTVLDAGVEYGLDFEVIIGSGAICISAAEITDAFRAHGIWTLEDLSTKSSEATAACASLVSLVYGAIVRSARDALGG